MNPATFRSQRAAIRPTTQFSRRQDDYYDQDDTYWQQDDRPRQTVDLQVDMDALEENKNQRGGSGVYNVYFEGSPPPAEHKLDWELDGKSTWVLLPPTYVSSPRAVIHFVGGTFFGSSPKLWYASLLEEIVRATQCTIVATPIPVTFWNNPLQHVPLSRKLARRFQSAYTNILEDEYGHEVLKDIPIVGMGHSLGARLLVVLATLTNAKQTIPDYKSYILMGFTNYASAASIPGIQSLLNQSKRLEDGEKPTSERKQSDYDYDDYDEEWDELMNDLTGGLKEQAEKLRTALTPRSKELEFNPSPNQLWKALKEDQRYNIPQTLIVQFDEDNVDQSPRLTDCLLESTDIKYCRLRGTHLTPVKGSDNDWFPLLQASKTLWKLLTGKQSHRTTDAFRDLRQSIARYITDVVAK
jgi:hypothetical protein